MGQRQSIKGKTKVTVRCDACPVQSFDVLCMNVEVKHTWDMAANAVGEADDMTMPGLEGGDAVQGVADAHPVVALEQVTTCMPCTPCITNRSESIRCVSQMHSAKHTAERLAQYMVSTCESHEAAAPACSKSGPKHQTRQVKLCVEKQRSMR